MRERSRLIIDLSSVAKRCYYAGQDKEFGWKVEFLGKSVHVNGWEHGREAFLNYMDKAFRELDAAPIDCIFVLEGAGGSQLRRNFYPGYKMRAERPPEQGEQYAKMQDWIVSYFKRLGSIFVLQNGVEADDVVAYLAKSMGGYVLMDDGDGLILSKLPGVAVRYQSKLIDPNAENPLGRFPMEFNRIYKAIVGDKSDTLPGAAGFGDGAFEDLYVVVQEDGMRELATVINDGRWNELKGDVEDLLKGDKEQQKAAKALLKIIEHGDTVRRCYKCVGFLDHLVNVPGKMLQWDPGMVLEKPEGDYEDKRVDHFFAKRRLVTSKNFSEIMASGIWAQIRKSPFVSLDLESYSPPESDEWLRKINDLDEEDAPKGVDMMAQKIAGMGLTFGDNQQFTLYFTVDHKTDSNISPEQLYLFLTKLLREDPDVSITVHSCSFELPVLFNNLIQFTGEDPLWDCGFLPRVEDSMFMASYVNENVGKGLKDRAQMELGYTQQTYDEVTTIDGKRYKMNELTPQQVFAYGTDDTIVSSALRNFYEVVMEIESTWSIYKSVEMDAAYLIAAAMVTGVPFNREEMRRQERADDAVFDASWAVVREYLVAKGWEGVNLPALTLDAASMKQAYLLVTGEALDSKARTPSKLVGKMSEGPGDAGTLATLYEAAIASNGDMTEVTTFVQQFHSGEPNLEMDSPKQMSKLIYETMALPVRVYNKATQAMRDQGIKKGTASTNALAIATAKFHDSETHAESVGILLHLHKLRGINTRRKLYYRPYRHLPHWIDGMIHGSFGQCLTLTRRFAPNKPNTSQLPVAKDKGDFRRNFVAHHKRAVVVSLDFKAQELRLIAEGSGDEVMISCYVGDNRRDMHHLTGLKIYQEKFDKEMEYVVFALAEAEDDHPQHEAVVECRKKGKTVNFASEFGAMAPKIAETLMVSLDESQLYLDAKHSTFWRAEEWKQEELIPQAKDQGFMTTMLGARRHLAEAFESSEWGIRMRAERQAVNFRIQGSAGEMTKLVMGYIWKSGMLMRYDAQFYFPVHDELVFSVCIDELVAFIQELHPLMVRQYADMKIPLESSIGIGLNFRDLIEIGEVPDTQLILGAVQKLFPGETISANAPAALEAA